MKRKDRLLARARNAPNSNVFDGFAVKVFLDEDGDYFAHFVEMPNVSGFANTPEDALKELAVAWQGVKKSYRKHNEPIPQAPLPKAEENSLNIPVDAQLYHALADEAAKSGMSLYALVAQKLSEPVPTAGSRNHLSRKLNSKPLYDP